MAEPASWVGARRLLRRLRDEMAADAGTQERLDRIVRIIAADMVAEVCSIYVRRAGDVLELFATEGLNKEAVHRTRLRVGEGLVGEIAAHADPLSLADAQSHPGFAFRPETGEEIYHSLMGVPIMRGGRVIGVLVVQNRKSRTYGEEEIETLETVAMVLAEVVAGGDLTTFEERPSLDRAGARSQRLEGVRLSHGLAAGRAWLHMPFVAIRRVVAESPETEHDRLTGAIGAVRTEIDALLARAERDFGGEPRDILETYRLFARDAGWLDRIREAINTGLSAEAAVAKVREDTRRRAGNIADAYLRERFQDIDDLAVRLLGQLIGQENATDRPGLPDDAILVARSLGPADLLDYPRDRIRAVLLEEGSATSHVAIIARALNIPMVGGLKDAFAIIEPNDEIVVDGDNQQVFVRPSDDVRERFVDYMAERDRRRAAYAKLKEVPSVTRDDARVSLCVNAGFLIDLPEVIESGADGVGLYRTELPFMVRAEFPDVEAQRSLYAKIYDQLGERPVVFRTLDIGGDKPLPYFDGSPGDNPALGWRAIRIGLDRPAILQRQLRALIQAAAGRALNVMFPMVAEVAELSAARAILDGEVALARDNGQRLPAKIQVGAMIEVPALIWQLDPLLPRVDFISVGSNDLHQFVFASDRGDPRVADRYDPLSPALLSALAAIADRCLAARVPFSVCGEIAGRPLEAMALVALGYRVLSMAPTSIGPVKSMIRSLDAGDAATFVRSLLARPDRSLRKTLTLYAEDRGVDI